jgi:DNA-binding transcriptional ArsR family regulator
MPSAGAPPVDDVFGALAHPIRRQLLIELARHDRTVSELAAPLPVSRPAVSQHLSVLREVGLVRVERSGREQRYRLRPEALRACRDWIATIDDFWSQHLQQLGRHLEQRP